MSCRQHAARLLTLAALVTAPLHAAWAQDASDTEAADETGAMDAELFSAIDDQIRKGDWQGAGDALAEILGDPAQQSQHGAAWGRMGRALKMGGLPAAALAAWSRGLEADPHAVAEDYPDLLRIAQQLHAERDIGGLVGADMSVPVDDDVRRKVALFAAKHHFANGNWGPATGMLLMVGDEGPEGLDAQILKGITLSQQSKFSEALTELLSAHGRARKANLDEHKVNVLALNVARTFFASGNFGRAMEYYNRVPRSDSYWPQAHFERAWAHFRVDDMPGTIALLHTHDSPFFEGWYFPEADLLRAQALFLMCKFPEALKSIDSFQATYQPVVEKLGETLGGLDAAAAVQDGAAFLEGRSTKLPPTVLRSLRYDDRFQHALETLTVATQDLSKLGALSSRPISGPATEALTAWREALRTTEGNRILDAARTSRDELTDMLQGIELTRIDLLTLEADLYTRAAESGEKLEFVDPIGQLRKLKKKGWRVWPFEGEYWADELGWYKLTGRPECPASMRRGDR